MIGPPQDDTAVTTENQAQLLQAGRHAVRLLALVVFILSISSNVAVAGGFKPPQDCLAYTGEHFQQCLYALIEMQTAKLSELQAKTEAQEGTIRQLQGQINERTATADQLQSQLRQQDRSIQNLQAQVQTAPLLYGPPYNPFYSPPYGSWAGGGVCLFGC